MSGWIEFTEAQLDALVVRYVEKRDSIATLADAYGVAPSVITRRLLERGVKLRSPGAHPRKSETHCKLGHPFDGVWYRADKPQPYRYCKRCRAANRPSRAKVFEEAA